MRVLAFIAVKLCISVLTDGEKEIWHEKLLSTVSNETTEEKGVYSGKHGGTDDAGF